MNNEELLKRIEVLEAEQKELKKKYEVLFNYIDGVVNAFARKQQHIKHNMNNEEQYNEAVQVIAQDMAEVIDVNNSQAVEEYLAVLNDSIVDELPATVEA